MILEEAVRGLVAEYARRGHIARDKHAGLLGIVSVFVGYAEIGQRGDDE